MKIEQDFLEIQYEVNMHEIKQIWLNSNNDDYVVNAERLLEGVPGGRRPPLWIQEPPVVQLALLLHGRTPNVPTHFGYCAMRHRN